MSKALLFFLTLFLTAQVLKAQSVYQFNGQNVSPGTQRNFSISIYSGKDSTTIPITVFNGSKPGKTLGITAGVHGYEFAPILAAQKLIRSINPQILSGVVILVNIANLESFKGRSPFISPVDNKNLNRSFPGSAGGTLTERIANFITEEVIAKSDYFLDMHSGDAPEDLFPYGAYYSSSSMAEVSELGRKMAISLGFDYVVNFAMDGKKYMEKNEWSLYCTAEAFKRGIPSVDIECGRLGLVEESPVDRIEKGVFNLLTFLNFLPNKTNSNVIKTPKLIKQRFYSTSKTGGFFYPLKKAGDIVTKGAKLGYSTDYFGEVTQEFYAEGAGVILLIVRTPPINPNEDVIVIGRYK